VLVEGLLATKCPIAPRHTRRCELGNSGAAAMRVGRRSIDHMVDSTWPFRSMVASALSSKLGY
jgi:hypothetical protein